MVKYREILRLEALGVSRINISFSVGCSPNTVQGVSNRAKAAGISWPLPEEMNDSALKAVLFSPKANEAREDLEVIEGRSRTGSTMLCSQFGAGTWHAKLGKGAVADAVIDRLVYNSHVIHIEGEVSMRKRLSTL